MCLYQMFETLFACCDQEKKRMDVENESQRQQEENCEQVNSEKPPEKKKRLGKKTSSVWAHFTVLVGSQPERAACNYCGQNYASSTKTCGTKSMWVHLDRCKKYPFANKEAKQMSIMAFTKKSGTGDSEEIVSKLSQKEIRAEITRYFIVDELPFRHVDGRGFRRFVKKAYPHFVFPSRVTIARDIYQLYLDTRKKLKNELKMHRMSLTTDCWTSIQNISYMCLTAHWIDNNWKLQKRILSFVQVPSHKGDMVGKELIACLNNWGITKVFAITVDNASSNSVALVKVKEYLQEKRHGIVLNGEMFHMRCCAHIVNLIVCDGLKEMGDSIASIRNAVRYVRSSSARLKRFKEASTEANIESKALLCLDVMTRWNSTYMMLEAALKFKKAFKNLEADGNYTKYFDEEKVNGLIIDGPPQNLDWDQAEIFVKFLKTFYELTLKFSGSLYVTSNLFFHEILDIQGDLRQLANEPGTASKMLEKVEKAMHSLYDFYKEMNYPLSKDVSMQGPNETESFPAMSSTSLGPNKMFSSWIRDQLQVDGDAQNNDLDDYLNDRRERLTVTDKFDILAWWKLNSQKYKIVSQIAKDVLAVQLSTVAFESTFSTTKILFIKKCYIMLFITSGMSMIRSQRRNFHSMMKGGRPLECIILIESPSFDSPVSHHVNFILIFLELAQIFLARDVASKAEGSILLQTETRR
ncbi:hypothetical protein UlMin_000237 [Ulmus minor]